MTQKDFDLRTGCARSKSVANPIAQTTTLCGVVGGGELAEMLSIERFSALCGISPQVAYIYALQRDAGLRVSEALAIMPSDITSGGFVRIRGKKGSSDVLVKPTFGVEYFLWCRQSGVYPFMGIDRYYVYRLYKSLGLCHKFDGNAKMSVTHLPRHNYALQAKSVDEDSTLVTYALRHKSAKNDVYYVKEK